MTAINLLPKSPQEDARLLHMKKTVDMLSTVLLVCVLLVVAGMTGWWLYLSTQKGFSTSEIETLSGQINALAQAEVLARQIATRSGKVEEHLSGRPDMPRVVGSINAAASDSAVKSWTYTDGKQSLTVGAPNPAQIEDMALALKNNYHVTLDILARDSEGNWLGTVTLLKLQP